MSDLTQKEIDEAVEQSVDAVVDEVLDDHFLHSLSQTGDARTFHVADQKLRQSVMTAAAELPAPLQMKAMATTLGASLNM